MPVLLPAETDCGMNRGIYSTALGMRSLQRGLDVTTNNLANSSTNGFKRDGLIFQDVLRQRMYADSGTGPSVGEIGAGADTVDEYTVFEMGDIKTTGNTFDMAISTTDGLFAVETPSGTRYTRDGAFGLDSNRRLVNKDGYPVLDKDGNEISIPVGDVAIENGGIIRMKDQTVATVGVWKPDAGIRLSKVGESLFEASGQMSAMDESPIVASSLEGSNVNAVESMLEMIRIGRLFELSQKNIQSQDDLLQKLISSLNE